MTPVVPESSDVRSTRPPGYWLSDAWTGLLFRRESSGEVTGSQLVDDIDVLFWLRQGVEVGMVYQGQLVRHVYPALLRSIAVTDLASDEV